MRSVINIFKTDLKNIAKDLKIETQPVVEIKNIDGCHYATTLALAGSKQLKTKPLEIAVMIKDKLEKTNNYRSVEIAGPGFINVILKNELLTQVIKEINEKKEKFGSLEAKNQIVNIEYVSANPTGYLHIGHARNAVIGSVLANVLRKAGYTVQTEYYVNDAGNQINILARPENSYGGEMYVDLAKSFVEEYGNKFAKIKYSETRIEDEAVHSIFRQKSVAYFLTEIERELEEFKCGDHHGYIARMKAGLTLLGNDPEILEIEFVQMVRLIKNGEEFKMSKHSIRYMLASKASNSHMDLDLDLIEQRNATNPFYYAQYMVARCNSIINQAKEKNIEPIYDLNNLLTNEKEESLMLQLDNFSEIINQSANKRLPHLICDYVQTISKLFHSYYSDNKIIDESNLELSQARIGLVNVALQVMVNAFEVLDIKAVEKM
ncbi:hypothetical protein FQA39_LY12842 [Lamprigera yunnana]|nr:hypothetical protein FQA39_LY12842 [Lamprigera yunnana]